MTINKNEKKRQVLNYREAGGAYGCALCEHFKDMECMVLNGGVQVDTRCDAWNSGETENTWHFLLYKIKETVCVLIKEENTTIAREEFPLTENIDKDVTNILEKFSKILGCPDILVNMSPRQYKSIQFKNWLYYRCIRYRELDVKIEVMEFKAEDGMTALDVLSLMCDEALKQ